MGRCPSVMIFVKTPRGCAICFVKVKGLVHPTRRALLALMLFHAARLESRVDEFGDLVLLADQDRQSWDQKLIKVARNWLIRSVTKTPSKFHHRSAHCPTSLQRYRSWRNRLEQNRRCLPATQRPLPFASLRIESSHCDLRVGKTRNRFGHISDSSGI